MEMIADILLIAGALGAAFYCFVLSRRLNRFTNLENGVGGAIAVLSAQVDDMTKMLAQAQGTASGSTTTLQLLTERAEDVSRRLELLVASMHDLPEGNAKTHGTHAPDHMYQTDEPEPDHATQQDHGANNVSQNTDPEADAPASFRTRRTWTQEAAE